MNNPCERYREVCAEIRQLRDIDPTLLSPLSLAMREHRLRVLHRERMALREYLSDIDD